MSARYTVPGMSQPNGDRAAEILQGRLSSLIDLQLTLKHIHWNVVGANFIGVHEMLDPQYQAVQLMVDDVAERIASLGHEPKGTPGFVASNRAWNDYSLGRAGTMEHLGALDLVYEGVIRDHRKAMDELDEIDLVSQDVLISQNEQLEKFHWFVRAHLEDDDGALSTSGTSTLHEAAAAAQRAVREERTV